MAGILIALGSYFLPIRHSGSIAVIYAILLGNLLVATRSSFVLLRKFINSLATVADRVLVIGAGSAGAMAANFVLQTRSRSARLVGFVDVDSFRLGKLVEGWRVLGAPEELEQIYGRVPFTEVLVADTSLSAEKLETLRRFGRRRRIPIRRFSINVDEYTENLANEVRGAVPSFTPSQRRVA
jgi:FlaA1/EpsC-like NDP-sugar epimerase